MASGHEKCRINRPDTWQLRPSGAKQIKSLDNTEPSTHGTKRALSAWADNVHFQEYSRHSIG